MVFHSFMSVFVLLIGGAIAVAHGAVVLAAQDAIEVPHLSGGIGEDEQQRLKARESDFNLKLVFTLVEGNYLADVGVEIKNGEGKTLVEHASNGPFFLAKLPAGPYTVAATYDGKTVTRKLKVGSRGLHTEYLRWPSNPQTDFPLSREQAEEPRPAAQSPRG